MNFLKELMPYTLEKIIFPVREQLLRVEDFLVGETVSRIETVDPIVRYVVQNGGKRIRPILFLLAAKMTWLNDPKIISLAAALEMFHTASLLHDDVVDDATIRRGKPSAKVKWGNQVSVLVGDLLLARASKIVASFDNSNLMEAVINAVGETTEGELLEIAHQNDIALDKNTYLKIIEGKTAVLFALASHSAAIIAKMDSSLSEALCTFGRDIGLAFQLTDDMLDYVADGEKLGKTCGADLREGKLTYPLIVALMNSSEDERAVIRNSLTSGMIANSRFREVCSIIEKHNGIEATKKLARDFSDKAKAALAIFKPSIERDALLALADYAISRDV